MDVRILFVPAVKHAGTNADNNAETLLIVATHYFLRRIVIISYAAP
jgi:hypothetical protein